MNQTLGVWGKPLVYTGYFSLSSVQVHFGVIRCISDFDDLVSQKQIVVERDGPQVGP